MKGNDKTGVTKVKNRTAASYLHGMLESFGCSNPIASLGEESSKSLGS